MNKVKDARHAGPQDLELCQTVLSELHGLGIKHGDVNKHNFLIHDVKATSLTLIVPRGAKIKVSFDKNCKVFHSS